MSDPNVNREGLYTKPITTVALLPAASAANAGQVRWVSDLNASRDTAKGQTAAGSGTTKGRVLSDGAAWRIHG